MPECNNCGEWVSNAFARVARIEGEVKACPECGPTTAGCIRGETFEDAKQDPRKWYGWVHDF